MGRAYIAGILLASVGLMGLTSACQRQAPDTRAADEQAVRAADADSLKAAQAKDCERWATFYASDASLFPPNAPIVTGRDAIRNFCSQLAANAGFAISWQIAKVEVSRAGDLAYAQGSYEMTLNDAKGKPVTDRGKWVVVHKRQADGTWKFVADIFNSDLPAPVAPPR